MSRALPEGWTAAGYRDPNGWAVNDLYDPAGRFRGRYTAAPHGCWVSGDAAGQVRTADECIAIIETVTAPPLPAETVTATATETQVVETPGPTVTATATTTATVPGPETTVTATAPPVTVTAIPPTVTATATRTAFEQCKNNAGLAFTGGSIPPWLGWAAALSILLGVALIGSTKFTAYKKQH